ncbi:MAG TPA: GAF domain-containing protein, partial [Candidatus Saccharimonadia bacterium]|nr:GAF domain-containing protein [Candidatus Saccharimonadia bacterium]
TTPLASGEVVLAIDGTSMIDWAARLFELGVDRPAFPTGTVVAMAIRDGGASDVAVTTIGYPIGPVVVRNLGTIAFVVVFLAVAGFAFRRRPRDAAAAALLIAATGAFASTIPWLLGLDPLAFATGAFWLDQGAVSLVYLLLWAGGLHFALAFPRRSPLLGLRPAGATLPYVLVFGLYGIGVAAMVPVSADPLAWIASWNVVQLMVVLGSLVAIMVAIADGWRRSDVDERRAFRWITLSVAFAVVASIVLFFVPELLTGRSLVPWSLVGLIDIPVPLAMGAAILRNQAFGIEVVVRRIVVYGGLTAGVVLVYALIVAGLSDVLGADADFPERLLAAGGAALVALPLRDLLQRAVGRYIYGDRDEPYRAISRLNERLALVMEPASTLQTVADTIADALRLPFVAVEVGEPGRLVASHGSVRSGVIRIPLVHGGEAVGHLLAAPRVGEEALSARDRSLLEDLAGQAAATVHAVHLTLDLQASRERLVAALEDERRRLRRDLHDGL